MLTDKDVLSFEFFKYGGVFSGSFSHMEVRYRITRVGEKPDFTLKAWVWSGPESFDIVSKREQNDIREESFPYSREGRLMAIEWVSTQCPGTTESDS